MSRFVELFGEGGVLEDLEGLNLDVARWTAEWATGANKGRDLDVDADGKGDDGFLGGVNMFGVGFYRFCRALRDALGPTRLLTADGRPEPDGQRAFGVLNGVESEWWPLFGDKEIAHWSSGINEHRFWRAHAHPPHFSYINHKVGGMGREAFHGLPWGIHRLVFAAGMFLDSALTSCYMPPTEPGEPVTFWDEWVKGREKVTGWLGFPKGETLQLALQTPDRMPGPPGTLPVERVKAERARVRQAGGQLQLTAASGQQADLRIRLKDIPAPEADLLLRLAIRAEPMSAYPADVASAIGRLVKVTLAPSHGDAPELVSYTNESWFSSTFYRRDLEGVDTVDVVIEIQGTDPVQIRGLTAHAHPDVMVREFEHGLVLANPSLHEHTFDLSALTPGRRYRRLKGHPRQDPETNNGEPVGRTVTLGPRDGLFLVKT